MGPGPGEGAPTVGRMCHAGPRESHSPGLGNEKSFRVLSCLLGKQAHVCVWGGHPCLSFGGNRAPVGLDERGTRQGPGVCGVTGLGTQEQPPRDPGRTQGPEQGHEEGPSWSGGYWR